MADANAVLNKALERFVGEALTASREFTGGELDATRPDATREFAAVLESLPSAKAADRAALAAAKANEYLRRVQRATKPTRAAGRPLTRAALWDTGVAGLLLTGEPDGVALVTELAGYLAGPSIPMWEYCILDADIAIADPIPVVDNWELVVLSSQELVGLMAVPSGASYAARPGINLNLHQGLAMLRRLDSEGEPHAGWIFSFDLRPSHTLWQPLLALSLYQNAVVQLWGRFHVEPGRRVDVLFDRVYTEPWTPDGVVEAEVVRRGEFRIGGEEEARIRSFLRELAPLLADAIMQPSRPTKATMERAAQFRRVAEHFLTASEDAHGEGEVLSEFNADAVLHYVIALEAILAGGESDKSDLTRKVVQRAAVLAGTDDEGRALWKRRNSRWS